MILPAIIAVAALGAAGSAWGLPRTGRPARLGLWAGVLGLLGVLVLTFVLVPAPIGPGGTPEAAVDDPFGGYLVPTSYLRLVVGLEALMSVVLVFAAWLLGGMRILRGLLPATLAALAGTAVALASADLGLAVASAITVGLAALAIILLDVEGPQAIIPATRELRVTLVGGAVLLAVVEALPLLADLVARSLGAGEGTAGSGEVGALVGLLTLAGTGAIAARYGVLPFHLRVPRLTDLVPPVTLPLLLAWIPLPLAVAGISAVDNLVAPLALPLEGERVIVILVAVATMTGAALAAFTQDDLRHATGYLVIADAGIVVLAAAALDPAAWGPARTWVVVLAASKTALAAWAAVTEDRFRTRSIPDLRGWVRRSPLLAASLVVATVATFGLPGWVAFSARELIASLVADGTGTAILVVLGWLALPAYLRLLVVGAGRVTSRVDAADPERFTRAARRTRHRAEPHPSEPEPAATVAATTAGEVTGAGVAVVDEAGISWTADAADAAGTRAPASPVPAARSRVGAVRGRAGAAMAAAGESVSSVARSGRQAVASHRMPHADPEPLHERLSAALRRDRAELLAGAVLALAMLAALTSWGALDIASAASEPAPAVVVSQGD
jgi:NADH:ubiquinone oxidoreductase subunit 2 (subunit N)